MSFYEYMMSRYRHKYTPEGDLAKDMERDNKWTDFFSNLNECSVEHQYENIKERLVNCHACSRCLETFERCYEEYKQACKLQGKEKGETCKCITNAELLECVNFVGREVLLDNLIEQAILLTNQVGKLTELYKDKPKHDVLRLEEAKKKFDDATYLLECLYRNLASSREKCEEIINRAKKDVNRNETQDSIKSEKV